MKNYSKLKETFKDDPEMVRKLELQEQTDLLREIASKKMSFDGVETLKGDKGDTGQKGEKGDQGLSGSNGKNGLDGINGKDGKNGKNGLDGKDGAKGEKGDTGKNGKDGDSTEVEDVIKELKKKQYLEPKDIKGMPINMSDMRWHGGGISNITGLITPGTNVTITGSGTSLDPYIINSSGGGTPGAPTTSIQYNSAGTFAGSSSLEWDNTNKQLILGTTTGFIATTNTPLQIGGSVNTYLQSYLQNASNGTSASTDYIVGANNDGVGLVGHYSDMGVTSSGWTTGANPTFAGFNANEGYFYTSGGNVNYGTDSTAIKWYVGGFTSTNLQATLTATGLGINVTAPATKLDIQGTATTDLPVYSAELLSSSGWTSTNWTGSFAAGWTHVTTHTNPLTNTLAAVIATKYQISYIITGRTAGTVAIVFGGIASGSVSATGAFGPTATSTGTLSITPTTDFDGTIVISIKSITGGSTALVTLRSSDGTIVNEMRANNIATNTFVGVGSGRDNTTGIQNTVFGSGSFLNNTTGISNVALGWNVLVANSTGQTNVGLGGNTLPLNTTGSNNMAIGFQALAANTTAAGNVAVGLNALLSVTSGGSNVAIGTQAGRSLTSGSSVTTNTFIGDSAGFNASQLTTATNSMALGSGTFTTASNQVVIGNTSVTQMILNGAITANNLAGTGTRSVVASSTGVLSATAIVNGSPFSTTTGINAKTVANTLAYTNATGNTIIITNAVVRCTAASAITVGPTVGIGTASGTSDIFAATALMVLTTTSSIFGFALVGMSVSVPNGGTIYINVTSSSTGTSQTLSVDLMGYAI